MRIDLNKPCHVYFIGIGGISMSGLAAILLSKGFKVSGSDSKESELTDNLVKSGATVYYTQDGTHFTDDIDLVVYTAAIRANNPEFVAMKASKIPYMTRGVFLGELMKNYRLPIAVSGTHGKTTTTTMLSEMLLGAECDPTLSVGGIINSINSTIRIGGPDYFVFEACEYTNSFLDFFPKISIILNIEEDHLDFFKDINDIRASFNRFANILPNDGLLIINGGIDNLSEITKGVKCPVLTFGESPENDYYYSDVTFDEFAHPSFICHIKQSNLEIPIKLNVTGIHNVLNSLAAIAVCDYLGINSSKAYEALSLCSGSKRRFEIRGQFDGVTVIDDYAHHPSEIKATLNAAKKYPHNTLWCIFQPHTYTRTKAFLHDFVKALSIADKVIVTDVYAAREKDEYGCNSQNLYDEMVKFGVDVTYIKNFSDIEEFVHKNCINGDVLITMGAGNVVDIANNLVK